MTGSNHSAATFAAQRQLSEHTAGTLAYSYSNAQNGLGLTDEQTRHTWAVLAEFGTMLSPSVMFVIAKILEEHKGRGAAGEPPVSTT